LSNNELSWYIRILLFFRRMQYDEKSDDGINILEVHYKTLFGRRYVYFIVPKPPQHFNCKCSLEAYHA